MTLAKGHDHAQLISCAKLVATVKAIPRSATCQPVPVAQQSVDIDRTTIHDELRVRRTSYPGLGAVASACEELLSCRLHVECRPE